MSPTVLRRDDALNMTNPASEVLSLLDLKPSCHYCLSDKMIIPTASVCNGKIDCHDLSDECLCKEQTSICKDIKYLHGSNHK